MGTCVDFSFLFAFFLVFYKSVVYCEKLCNNKSYCGFCLLNKNVLVSCLLKSTVMQSYWVQIG